MTRPQLDPEVARRVLREKYPYAWAYTLNIRMAEAFNAAVPAFARAAIRMAQAVDAIRYAGRSVPCRLCGQAGGHHPGCLLGDEP